MRQSLLALFGFVATAALGQHSASAEVPTYPPLTPPCLTCSSFPPMGPAPIIQGQISPAQRAGVDPAATPPQLDWREWSGPHSAVAEPTIKVANDQHSWQVLLALAGDASLASVPFDPAHQIAVGVFLGQRNTGGYGVRLVRVGARDGRYVIEVDETSPGPGSFVTQALTTPWAIVVMERPELPVSVEPRFRTQG